MRAHYDPEVHGLYVQVAERVEGVRVHTEQRADGVNIDRQGDRIIGYEFLLPGPLDILTSSVTRGSGPIIEVANR